MMHASETVKRISSISALTICAHISPSVDNASRWNNNCPFNIHYALLSSFFWNQSDRKDFHDAQALAAVIDFAFENLKASNESLLILS